MSPAQNAINRTQTSSVERQCEQKLEVASKLSAKSGNNVKPVYHPNNSTIKCPDV